MAKDKEHTDYSYCHVVGQTDVGRKRKANEDNGGHFTTINGLVSVVCDGMGGHVGGAIASQIAVETIREFLDCQYYEDPREAIGLAIQTANEAIIKRTQVQPELSGMGSTCVLLIVREGKVYIGHVGDSRIYLIREKNIIQLTKDHSFVQTLVDMGRITKEEAEHHPRKNEITNALGIPQMAPATIRAEAIDPQVGDCFLLCSDGLSGMVNDRAIERIISKQMEFTPQQRADILVQTANANGGIDNITVELVEFVVNPMITCAGKNKFPRKLLYALLAFLAFTCIFIFSYMLLNNSSMVIKKLVIPDIELVSGYEEPIFKLSPKDGNKYLFESCYPHGDTRSVLAEVLVEGIKTNMISSNDNGVVSFKISSAIIEDSVYLELPTEDTLYRYSSLVKVNPEEIKMGEIEFRENGDVATIESTKDGQFILKVTGGEKPEIIDSDKFEIFPEHLRIVESNSLTTIKFKKSFFDGEIRLLFYKGESCVRIYVIPTRSVSIKKGIEKGITVDEKKDDVSRDLEPIILEYELELESDLCPNKIIKVTRDSVIFDGKTHSIDCNLSQIYECNLNDESLKTIIEHKGFSDGEFVELQFKETIPTGEYVIEFPCKKDGTEVTFKLTLNIK